MNASRVTITILNAKGGSTKTTTSHNLGHALVNSGKRVLLVDLDPQGSLSLSCGVRPSECENTIADVLLEGAPLGEAVCETSIPGLDIVPGSMSLGSYDVSMAYAEDRATRLKDALHELSGYDIVLIDSPPTLGLLPVNALTAADFFVVPTQPEYLALEGLSMLLDAVERTKEGLGDCAELLGIVLTRVDKRSKATKELTDLLRSHYGDLVFEATVPVNVRLSEAPSHGKSIFQYDHFATGAQTYRQVADELLDRLNSRAKVKL